MLLLLIKGKVRVNIEDKRYQNDGNSSFPGHWGPAAAQLCCHCTSQLALGHLLPLAQSLLQNVLEGSITSVALISTPKYERQ